MSRAVEKEEDLIPDELKTMFDWCKEGHVTNLAAMVTAENINKTCDNVRCDATCAFSKSDHAAVAISPCFQVHPHTRPQRQDCRLQITKFCRKICMYCVSIYPV